jgi:hypothetical protein
MKMMKYLASAIFASFFAIAPASAMPGASTTGLDRADASSLVQVQYHGHNYRRPHYGKPHYGKPYYGKPHRPAYRPGGRYSTAPHGYRRYGVRPHDWRTRSCVMVGPAWFCP